MSAWIKKKLDARQKKKLDARQKQIDLDNSIRAKARLAAETDVAIAREKAAVAKIYSDERLRAAEGGPITRMTKKGLRMGIDFLGKELGGKPPPKPRKAKRKSNKTRDA